MLLIDSSLWIPTYRDPSGRVSSQVQAAMGGEEHAFCQMTRVELLQGCRDEAEWAKTKDFLDDQEYREISLGGWTEAARIYFELRRSGETVRSTLDCCIAVVALEHDLTVLHNDQDYEKIAKVRPLKHRRLALGGP